MQNNCEKTDESSNNPSTPVNSVRQLQCLTGHTNDVTTCDFTPDFTLITGSSDKSIRIWIWSVGSGYSEHELSPLLIHKYPVTCVRVSKQGAMFASSSVDGTTILWNLASFRKLHIMTQINGDAVRVCHFAPNSCVLVTGSDSGAICIWDLVHRSLIRSIFDHEGSLQSVSFTSDSQYLITACTQGLVKIWYLDDVVENLAWRPNVYPLCDIDNVHDLGVLSVDVCRQITINELDPTVRSYKMATSGNSEDIKIWRITVCRPIQAKASVSKNHLQNSNNRITVEMVDQYQGHNSFVTCIRYNYQGDQLVTCSLDKLVKIWDCASGQCLTTLHDHSRYVICVAISKNSTLIASGSNDKSVIVWDLSGKLSLDRPLLKMNSFQRSHSVVKESEVSEQQLLTLCHSNTDNDQSDQMVLLQKCKDIAEGAINSCCFSRTYCCLATASSDNLVRIFTVNELNGSINELKNVSPLVGHTYPVNHVDYNRTDDLLVSCSQDGYSFIWNVKTGENLTTLAPSSLAVKMGRFSSDSKLLVTGGDEEVAAVWEVSTGFKIATLEGHLDAISSVGFTSDGRLICTTSQNGDFRLWRLHISDINNWQCDYIEQVGHEYGIQNSDFAENAPALRHNQGYLLATCGNDGAVKLWQIHVETKSPPGHIEVKLWQEMLGHGGNVLCVRFSPLVGEFVCSTGTDRQARIWSVYSGDCLFTLDHDAMTLSCSFSSTCRLLAIGCLDGTLCLWALPDHLVFQSTVATTIHRHTTTLKTVLDWTEQDVANWLRTILSVSVDDFKGAHFTGAELLDAERSADDICQALNLTQDDDIDKLTNELRWLRYHENIDSGAMLENELRFKSIPHEFLCPITQEIMHEPVHCSDGGVYEKRAILEWFLAGRFVSPLTNQALNDLNLTVDMELRDQIRCFLGEHQHGCD